MYKTQINNKQVVDFYVKLADGLHKSTAAYYMGIDELHRLSTVEEVYNYIDYIAKYQNWGETIKHIVMTDHIDTTDMFYDISTQGDAIYAQEKDDTLYIKTAAPNGSIRYFGKNNIFYNMEKLEDIDINFINKLDLNEINTYGFFYNCSSLKSIENFRNYTPNTEMTKTFYNCNSITDWEVLDTWDVSNIRNMDYCFSGSNIANIPKWTNTDNIQDYGSIFLNCYGLEPSAGTIGWYDFSTWRINKFTAFTWNKNDGLYIEALFGMAGKSVNYHHWNENTDNEYFTYTPPKLFYENKNITCITPAVLPKTQKRYIDDERTKYINGKLFVDGSYWYTDGTEESPFLNSFQPQTEIRRITDHPIKNLKMQVYKE